MSLSAKQLTEALRIRKLIDELDAKRHALAADLEKALSGTPVVAKVIKRLKRGKKRTRRQARAKKAGAAPRVSQKQLVRDILGASSTPLSLDQIVSAVKAKGFKSKSKEPKRALSVLVSTDKAIARAGRGLYTVKSAAVTTAQATSKKAKAGKAAVKKTVKKAVKKATRATKIA